MDAIMGPRTTHARPVVLACLAIVVALLASVPPAANGLPATRDHTGTDAVIALRPPGHDADFPNLPPRCYKDDGETPSGDPCHVLSYGRNRPTVAVWGDSHAWMYLPALRQAAKRSRVSLIMIIAGGCPPTVALPEGRQGSCETHNAQTLKRIGNMQHRIRDFRVLIVSFWSGYRQAYRLVQRERAGGPDSGLTSYREHQAELAERGAPPFFRRLGRMKLDVDVMSQAATVPLEPKPCAAGREPYQCDLPRAKAMNAEGNNRRWLRKQMSRLSGTPRLLDATPGYCTADVCRAHVAGGANLFYDDIHLAKGATRTLTRYFLPSFRDFG